MQANPNYLTFKPSYQIESSKIENFLKNFESPLLNDPFYHGHKYLISLQAIANRDSKLVEIHTEDLEAFFDKSEDDAILLNGILTNTKRYVKLFYDAVDKIMPPANKRLPMEDLLEPTDEIWANQRIQNVQNLLENKNSGNQPSGNAGNQTIEIPKELTRKYELIITPGQGSKNKTSPMRELRSEQIGSLIAVRGIVVRATDVKPFLKVACYSCDICGYETYQIISGRTYMPLTDCSSQQCKNNRSHGKITQMNRTSKFVSFQELKIQEPTHEVPVGRVPRSITVFALGSSVRQCSPGDTVTIHGIYLPSMVQGKHIHRSRWIHDTYIESFKIEKEKKSYKETSMTPEMMETLKKQNKNIYTDLAKSIAPEIYGMDDIKKAILLWLVSGVDKTMPDGMKIRGNINLLLMGDPGIAKSQLLKYVSHISPRGIYTTGKGSSGVGLTAAVVKDEVTNDLVLEGGALVLADMGVCCIDEFDKMSDYDRANIHEVMEQQTVSIAKAGITTRLNARASVLAAANPLYGRYNPNLTPHENINLPAAWWSRFDWIFLWLDKADSARDLELAMHVVYVHQHCKPPALKFKPFDISFIRSYIAQAKKTEPTIPKELHDIIIEKYVEKRKLEGEVDKQGYQYITPRSLLAIIRLAQSLAKLSMNNKVTQNDVDEAIRLVEASQSSINTSDENENRGVASVRQDARSAIYAIIKELCGKNKNNTCTMDVIERKVIQKGFTKKQLETTIENYVSLSILYVDDNDQEVTLL